MGDGVGVRERQGRGRAGGDAVGVRRARGVDGWFPFFPRGKRRHDMTSRVRLVFASFGRSSHLVLQEHGQDAVADLREEAVRVGVTPREHELDAFLVRRERDLRFVQDFTDRLHGGLRRFRSHAGWRERAARRFARGRDATVRARRVRRVERIGGRGEGGEREEGPRVRVAAEV